MRQKTIQCKHIPVEEILAACWLFHLGWSPTPEIALADKYPANVILKKMEKLVDLGLLDYGVSLRTAWPEWERINQYFAEKGVE